MKTQEKKYPQRSNKQNNSLHLLFRQMAEQLNDSGYEQKITIGTVDTPWNEWSVKVMFSKIASAQFGKPHTSDLTTKELQEVYETLNRVIAEQGLHIPFPSLEEVLFQQNGQRTTH